MYSVLACFDVNLMPDLRSKGTPSAMVIKVNFGFNNAEA
jgi:hypothetical protein